MSNLRTYCNNLLQSVNAKLSGENKQVVELKTRTKTMFIGADVQHTKNNYSGELPSIAAVVASMNSECTLTNQRVSRQWPSQGKQSEEAILLLKTMAEELLIAFKDNNNGALPEHIVFYRDGVDDGQFERVQNQEVAALKEAFQGKNGFSFNNIEKIDEKNNFLSLFSYISSKFQLSSPNIHCR
jgi:eukaryotic translation initiation factor 2C